MVGTLTSYVIEAKPLIWLGADNRIVSVASRIKGERTAPLYRK